MLFFFGELVVSVIILVILLLYLVNFRYLYTVSDILEYIRSIYKEINPFINSFSNSEKKLPLEIPWDFFAIFHH